MVKMNEYVHFPGLIIRYRQQEELMLDILRYGAEVEVISPRELRQAVCRRLSDALRQYNTAQKK